MSKTILIGSLLNGAHISNNVKLRTLCRFFVMFNIIGKSVLQLTNLNARVVHNRLLRIKTLRICSNGQSHSEQNQKKSLHIVNIKKLSFLCYLLPQLLFPLCCSSHFAALPSAALPLCCSSSLLCSSPFVATPLSCFPPLLLFPLCSALLLLCFWVY